MQNILPNLLPSLTGNVLPICYIPQIVTTLKTKEVSGMSVQFWVLLTVALGLLFTNSVYVFVMYGDWGYMLTEGVNVGLALVMLTLVLKYRNKSDKVDEVNK